MGAHKALAAACVAILVASLTCARPGADPPTLAEVAEAENPRPNLLS